MSEDSEKIAEYWGRLAKEKVQGETPSRRCPWTDSSLIQKYYIHPTISGRMDANWFIWVKENFFFEPAERALNLGCGDGCLERHGAAINVFKYCDAFDMSPGAIEIAKAKAEELGIQERIHYEVADANQIHLKKAVYDVVFSAMALHHIENLEHVLEEIGGALKKDGLFIISEYVGPNHFQWTDEQLRVANDLLLLLPERFRIDPATGIVRNRIDRQPLSHMMAIDPSEGVRSEDIIPLIEERFRVIKRIDYGGTILNLLLNDIILNFDENQPEDMAILRLIFYIEKFLIRKKILDSDFTFMVAQKR
ncbi:MAG: class I SAM-dependent methyltransferase [Syntrophaceae bacterium]|nr:class I SAM-dependent methyltransferase [Syntrophaceae bacterium]